MRCNHFRLMGWLCALALLGQSGSAHAQALKTIKEEIAGSWRLVSITNTRVDGGKYELFGEKAKGALFFDKNGTYSPAQ